MMNLIKIDNLYLGRKGKVLLHDIHFELNAGEVMLLTGVPGSGKSLILKIIANIIKKYNGELQIHEQLHKKKRIAYLPQMQKLTYNDTGKEFAMEYLTLNHYFNQKDRLMELVKIFTHFDQIELLRKNLEDMTMVEKKIFLLVLLLCTDPLLILLDSPIEEDVVLPLEFINKYIHYLKEHEIGAIIASRIQHIVPIEYDFLFLVHNGWMVYSARKEQIEHQLEGYILRIKPPELERELRGLTEIEHKIYIKEENAIDIILKPDANIQKISHIFLEKEIKFQNFQIFKPNIRQFLKYKLEEFNIVESS